MSFTVPPLHCNDEAWFEILVNPLTKFKTMATRYGQGTDNDITIDTNWT
jgi:hypothetical protein